MKLIYLIFSKMAISSFSETFESGSWKSKAELFYPL